MCALFYPVSKEGKEEGALGCVVVGGVSGGGRGEEGGQRAAATEGVGQARQTWTRTPRG